MAGWEEHVRYETWRKWLAAKEGQGASIHVHSRTCSRAYRDRYIGRLFKPERLQGLNHPPAQRMPGPQEIEDKYVVAMGQKDRRRKTRYRTGQGKGRGSRAIAYTSPPSLVLLRRSRGSWELPHAAVRPLIFLTDRIPLYSHPFPTRVRIPPPVTSLALRDASVVTTNPPMPLTLRTWACTRRDDGNRVERRGKARSPRFWSAKIEIGDGSGRTGEGGRAGQDRD